MAVDSRVVAFGKALGAWFALWFVTVHLFVAWNWNAYSVSPRSEAALLLQQEAENKTQTPEPQVIQENRPIVVDQTAQWQETVAHTRYLVETTQTNIQRLQAKQAQVQETLERMNQSLDNLSVKEKYLHALQDELATLMPNEQDLAVFVDGKVPPDRDTLGRQMTWLLRQNDLGKFTEVSDMQRDFDALVQYMKEMETDGVQWVGVNEILQQDFPTKESAISACPAIPEEDDPEKTAEAATPEAEENKTPDVPSVTIEDLENHKEAIQKRWDELYEKNRALPVSDEEMKRLEKIRQRLVDEWMQRVRASLDEALDKVELAIERAQASSDAQVDEEGLVGEVVGDNDEEDDGGVKCAKTDDVLAVLEAGIEAVHRKMDLQQVLQQAMSERDGELKNVILDADLPFVENRPAPAGPETLRQHVDTALLTHDVPGWIHALIDLAGGRIHEEVDKYLDTLPENVGEIAVQNMLDAAGQVNLREIQGNLQRHLDGMLQGVPS